MSNVESHSVCIGCEAKSTTIFNECQLSDFTAIEKLKKNAVFKRGDTIFQQGNLPKRVFCIQQGKVKLVYCAKDGKEQVVKLLGPGDFIGHRALFGNDAFSSSAIAMEESEICFFEINEFRQLLQSKPKLLFKIANQLAKDLKLAEIQIAATAQFPVKIRIVKTLYAMYERFGLLEDNRTLSLQISRSEFAEMVGSTRETVTRYLYELHDEGFIQINGRKILILKGKKLLEQYLA